jgi:undecaprenyl-diphosphatase
MEKEKSWLDFDLEDNLPSNKSFPINILSWIGRHELTVLLAFVMIFGGIWLTVTLADGVVEGDTQETDLALMMLLREGEDADNPIGPAWVEELMRDYTALAGTGFLVLIITAVTIYYLIQGHHKEMAFLLIAVLGAFLISYLLKDIFDRPRPEFVAEGAYKYSASFPSGHALLAATTYLTLGSILAQLFTRDRLKAYVLILATIIVVLVGFTRVYLGVHYPTDVLAGWVIGTVWATMCWLGFRWLRRREANKSAEVKEEARKIKEKDTENRE